MSLLFKLSTFCLCLLAISACDSEPDIQIDNGTLTTALPNQIREVARLGTVPLRLRVTINDSSPSTIGVDNATTEAITVQAEVPADQTNTVKVEWLAVPENTPVLLAEFINTTQPNQEELLVSLYIDSGEERFDTDGDGLTNLQEARENRNILGEFDLEVPLQTNFLGATEELIQGSIDPDISGESTEPDANTTFSLRHDGTTLFLYVCGQDEVLRGDNINGDGQFWHDDTVFVYLDGANSDSGNYDGIDDFQLAFVRSTEEMIIAKGNNNQFCPNGSCIDYIDHEFDPRDSNTTECIYELEVEMQMAELNITPGIPLGFDLEITDDDNGDLREGSSGFIGFDDRSDLDPSTFGTIRLE